MDSQLGFVIGSGDGSDSRAAALKSFWHDANVGVYLVRVLGEGQFVYEDINPAHQLATGLSQADIFGRAPDECLPADTARIVVGHYRACVSSNGPVLYTETLELPAGQRIWQTSLVPVRDGGGHIVQLVGCCRDVTELVHAERELARVNDRMVEVQEEERRRIAQDLHDGTSQHLVAAQLCLMVLRREGARGDVLDDISRELAEAQKEIRTFSYLLHPPNLARSGLSGTLRAYATGFRKRTGIAVELEIHGQFKKLHSVVEGAIFRVVQEALANVHRHANASCISITLSRSRDGVRLLVLNDGRRPGDPAPALTPGLGIPGMQARIQRLGGTLSVTATDTGVAVTAFIPSLGLRLPASAQDLRPAQAALTGAPGKPPGKGERS